jgi:hypothetical protein
MRNIVFAGSAAALVYVVVNSAIRLLNRPSNWSVAAGYFLLLALVAGTPDSVKQAIEAKTAATQYAERAENEKRQAIAEAAKTLEIARGQAQANELLTKSLSPQLMQWRQLAILDQKWNGQFPQVVGSGTMPLLQLGK